MTPVPPPSALPAGLCPTTVAELAPDAYAPTHALGKPRAPEPHEVPGEHWECPSCGRCHGTARGAVGCCTDPPTCHERAYMCRRCGALWAHRASARFCCGGVS